MKLSAALAEHISTTGYDDVPAPAIEAAKRSLLDAVGVSVAASSLAAECGPFLGLAREENAAPVCSILGAGGRTSPFAAVLANGSLAHALDFEDSHDAAMVHPNAPIVPVLLALAEAHPPVTGRQLLTAMAIGCDLTCRLSLAVGPRLLERGWYPPSLLAGFGAAAAGARLLGLDPRGVLDALSLVLGQLGSHGELMHSPRSSMRSVRDAFPAHAALVSALLARRRVRGYDRPLEGASGFFAAYAQMEPDEHELLRGLGVDYAGAGISFKPWPSCRGTHAFIQGAIELARRHALTVAAIDRVHLRGAPAIAPIVAEPRERKLRPRTLIDAKFSVYFSTALALRDRDVGLGSFTHERLADASLLGLAQRMTFEPDDRFGVEHGAVEITSADGRRLATEITATYGNPAAPISDADLLAKYQACVAHAAAPEEAARWSAAAGAILELEDADDVAAALAGPA